MPNVRVGSYISGRKLADDYWVKQFIFWVSLVMEFWFKTVFCCFLKFQSIRGCTWLTPPEVFRNFTVARWCRTFPIECSIWCGHTPSTWPAMNNMTHMSFLFRRWTFCTNTRRARLWKWIRMNANALSIGCLLVNCKVIWHVFDVDGCRPPSTRTGTFRWSWTVAHPHQFPQK